jgi:hypothetical protein
MRSWTLKTQIKFVALVALLFIFAAYPLEEVRHDNLTKEHGWQTIKVCGGRPLRIPAEWPADDYKKATELDCGIFPPRHSHSPQKPLRRRPDARVASGAGPPESAIHRVPYVA